MPLFVLKANLTFRKNVDSILIVSFREELVNKHTYLDVLYPSDVERILSRIAYEVVEQNRDNAGNLILVAGDHAVDVSLAQTISNVMATERGVQARVLSHREVDPAEDFRAKIAIIVTVMVHTGFEVFPVLRTLLEMPSPPREVRIATFVTAGSYAVPLKVRHVGRNIGLSRQQEMLCVGTLENGIGLSIIVRDSGR